MGSNSQMFLEKTERYQNQGALFYFGAWVLAQVIEENQPLACELSSQVWLTILPNWPNNQQQQESVWDSV